MAYKEASATRRPFFLFSLPMHCVSYLLTSKFDTVTRATTAINYRIKFSTSTQKTLSPYGKNSHSYCNSIFQSLEFIFQSMEFIFQTLENRFQSLENTFPIRDRFFSIGRQRKKHPLPFIFPSGTVDIFAEIP